MRIRVLDINHIGLFVSDLESSVRFYSTTLCLKRKLRPDFGDKGAWFEITPGQELHVIERNKANPIANDPVTHFALKVEDEESTISHLKNCGAGPESISKRPDGATQIFVKDPDGHSIELTCNLPE